MQYQSRAVGEMPMPAVERPPEKMKFQLTLRQRGISDQAVLRAMEEVPREEFVDPLDRGQAYRDSALGIACGQTISQPFVVAYMTEQLQLRPEHRILEIGTGSGYQAAVLSRLVRDVVTVERFRTLADTARERLSRLGCHNVDVQFGDGLSGDVALGRFDRVLVTAAIESIPDQLVDRLVPDGLLVAPVGPHYGVQMLQRLRLTAAGREVRNLVEVRFVPALPGLARET